MSPKFQTKEFNRLKEKWYKKLEDSGYRDIEQDENHLKEWDSYAFKSRYNKHLYASKETYFQLAGQFLHTFEFESKRHKVIWELHSNGMSITQIANALKSKRFKSPNRTSVHTVVQALSKEMLRIYGNEND